MGAPDITADFLSKLRTNGRIAHDTLRRLDSTARCMAFGMLARGSGLWDFKANACRGFRYSGVTVCGGQYRHDIPGNYR